MRRRLSPWMPVPGANYCCMRIIEGSDPLVIANRIAFIEKAARIRTAPWTGPAGGELSGEDWKNWKEGLRGCGGPEGHIPTNQLYGYYPPARAWCDAELTALNYVCP